MDEKRFQKGYIMGVFDLFHVGHLNLVKRAKEQCAELVVGVLSDELVMEQKAHEPFFSLEERMRILSAVRYVDEVVAVTDPALSKVAEWERIRFDVLFSGNDYEGNPMWEYEKKELEKRGATIVFFPYTKGTSSTLIRKALGIG